MSGCVENAAIKPKSNSSIKTIENFNWWRRIKQLLLLQQKIAHNRQNKWSFFQERQAILPAYHPPPPSESPVPYLISQADWATFTTYWKSPDAAVKFSIKGLLNIVKMSFPCSKNTDDVFQLKFNIAIFSIPILTTLYLSHAENWIVWANITHGW